MNQATGNGSRWTIGRILGATAAALLLGGAIIQPEVADAADGGDGGGRFLGGSGGFHGGGFHHGFGHSHGGFGIVGIYAPDWWGYGYPYSYYGYYGDYPDQGHYGYDPSCSYYGTCPNYGYGSHPSGRQTWYYCSDPAGYYPYVTQCKTGWLPVPAS
jgi:hypothetical protein